MVHEYEESSRLGHLACTCILLYQHLDPYYISKLLQYLYTIYIIAIYIIVENIIEYYNKYSNL